MLPIVLQIYLENYQTDPDLVSQFVKQKTAFHKTCMNKYDNYNFKQKDKTKQINISSYYVVETLCSTGRILSTPNCFDNCFFLVKHDAVNLHQCKTLSLDKCVRKMAQELVHTKLLAKLSEGDMSATEAKYLQDYTMPIVITTQKNLLKIVLWKLVKVYFVI